MTVEGTVSFDGLFQASGKVVIGYGAASGRSRFREIGGTICAQKPVFERLGLSLEKYFNGTINIDLTPLSYVPLRSLVTFVNVKWHNRLPAENFSFFDVTVQSSGRDYDALVYLPHPETKGGFEEHFPPLTTIELLAPEIEGIAPGTPLEVKSTSRSICFKPYGSQGGGAFSARGSLTFVEQIAPSV